MRLVSFLLCLATVLTLSATDLSLENYQNIVDNDPDRYKVYEKIGILFARMNDLTNAEINLRKAVKIDRTYAEGYYNLGVLKLNKGERNKAIEYFITALTFQSNHLESLVNLGNIYNIRNDQETALYYYKLAFRTAPEDPDLLNNMGVLAAKRKDYVTAVRLIEKAYSLKKDPEIRFNLAVTYYYNGQYAKIKELYPFVSPQDKHYSTILRLLNR